MDGACSQSKTDNVQLQMIASVDVLKSTQWFLFTLVDQEAFSYVFFIHSIALFSAYKLIFINQDLWTFETYSVRLNVIEPFKVCYSPHMVSKQVMDQTVK